MLVKVYASTVTRGDAMGVRGVEYRFTRVATGIRRPRRTSFGSEFAGRVEEVGAAVTEFKVGDEVFGVKGGANAEYVTVGESGVIAPKPTGLTFEEAAAIPDGSLLALTCLQPGYPLQGKSVLVYGAAGSVGTAAVQLLAHHFEADVTAVCDTKDVELVALARRTGRPRSLPRGLHEERQDLRRDLRRGRQALVPALPALAETGRDLHQHGPRVHVPRPAPRSRHPVRREQAGDARHRPLSPGGPAPRSRSSSRRASTGR